MVSCLTDKFDCTDDDAWQATEDDRWTVNEDYQPDSEDETWWNSVSRVGHGGDAPDEPSVSALPAVVWLEARVDRHRAASREEGDYHDLAATDLRDIVVVLRDIRCVSPRELVGRAGNLYSGLDLDAVSLPESRESHAADLLDEQASVYLAMGGDLSKLAAAAILRRADEVEALGAATLREYHEALDARYDELAEQASELLGYPATW